MAKTQLEIILSGQVRNFNAALKEAQRVADEALAAIADEAAKASDALEETGEAAKKAGEDLGGTAKKSKEAGDALGETAQKAKETGESLGETTKKSKETGESLGETTKKSKEASAALGETGQSAKKAGSDFAEITQAAQVAGAALGGLALAGGAITKSFVSEAIQMQKYEATLKALTGSTEEARVELEKYLKFAADAPAFDLKGVMDGALKMKALKVDVERFLPLAGDLAAVFDRSLPDAALALAKALSGSQDGLTQLADAFGVTKKELKEFGAATKGDAIDVTQIEKLQDALHKVISAKYGGVMMQQASQAAGAFASLDDAISRLKAAFGKEIVDDFAAIANALTDLIEKIEAWPAPIKSMVAHAVVFATVLATLGAAALGLTAALGPLAKAVAAFRTINAATAFTGLGAAISASAQTALTGSAGMATLMGGVKTAGAAASTTTTAFRALAGVLGIGGGLIAGATLLAGGLIALTAHQHKANDAAEKTQIAQQKVADRFRESRGAIVEASNALKEYQGDAEKAGKATAEAFKGAGKDDLDAAKAILSLVEQRNDVQTRLAEARENVSDLRAKSKGGAFSKQFFAAELAEAEKYAASQQELLDGIIKKVETFYGVREELSGTHVKKLAEETAAEERRKAAVEALAAALEDYNNKASAGVFATKREQLAALDQLLAGMSSTNAEYKKLVLARVKLAREAEAEAAADAEKTRKQNVDAAMWELDKLKAIGNDNFQQRKAVLEKILLRDDLVIEERKKLELELLQVEKTIGDNKVAIAKKTADAKLKAESEAAKLRVDFAKTDRGEADQEVDILKERLDLGEDVLGQLKQQLQVRQDMLEVEIKAAAEADKVGKSAAERATIDKQAESAITMSRKDTARETEALDRKNTESRKKSALEALKLEEQLADAKLKADKNVTQGDLNAHYKERLRLAEEILQLEAEIASATASPEEKAVIQAKLELDLYNTRKKSTEELAAASAELDKAKKKAEDLNKATFKGVQSLDDMIKDMSNLGGIRRRGSGKGDEDGGEGDRNRAAGNLGIDPNAKVPENDLRYAADKKGTKQSGGGGGGSGGFGVSKWERERAEEEAEKKGGGGEGGGSADSAMLEGFAMLDAAIQRFHADFLSAASAGSGVKVEIVTPQGQPSDGWSYTSQQT